MRLLNHTHDDAEIIRRRGAAFVSALAELERVLRSYGRDRRIATLIASQVLLDGLSDGQQT
jgi:hypothetical protein